MIEPSDKLILRRRKGCLALNSLFAASSAVAGMLIGALAGERFGYFMAAFCGACAIFWAILLVAPLESLVALPDCYFCWIGPEYAKADTRLFHMQPTGKPTLLMTEPTHSYGVWDRELDGIS